MTTFVRTTMQHWGNTT